MHVEVSAQTHFKRIALEEAERPNEDASSGAVGAVSGKAKKVKVGSKLQSGGPDSGSGTIPKAKDNSSSDISPPGKVILIKFLGETYTHPKEAKTILHNSVFQKYITSVGLLGNGNGLRVGIEDPNGKLPPLDKIKSINDGNVPVRCWLPGRGKRIFKGKISPIDVDISNEAILECTDILGGVGSQLSRVTRIKDRFGKPTLSVLMDFENSLPKKVAVDGLTYSVEAVKRPPLRCYKCLLFGHGTLTCRFNGTRCQRCCQTHNEEDIPTCSKPFFCLLCGEGHKYSDRKCIFNIKAQEIENKREANLLDEEEYRKALRELNKNKFSKGPQKNPTRLRTYNSPTHQAQAIPSEYKQTNRTTNSELYSTKLKSSLPNLTNQFESLTDDEEDFFLPPKMGKRRPSERSRYFINSRQKSPLAHQNNQAQIPEVFTNPMNEHSYTIPVTSSEDYRSHTDCQEDNFTPTTEENISRLFFKLLCDLGRIYFQSKQSFTVDIPKYEAVVGRFFSNIKNSL